MVPVRGARDGLTYLTEFEPENSEEQLEDMVDRIGQGEDVQIFSGFDFDEEQTKQIEERHNDLIELEKSLLELNEIFHEMAVMVESQERISFLSLTVLGRLSMFLDGLDHG